MSSKPFELHIDGRSNFPLQEGDSIIFSPLHVVKLEAQKIITVSTGIRLVDCKRNGKVVVVPYSKYADVLKFDKCEYSTGTTTPMTVEITNLTKEFVRVEPTDYLFSFVFVENKKSAGKKQSTQKQVEETKEEMQHVQQETSSEHVEKEADVVQQETSEHVPEEHAQQKKEAKRKAPVKQKRVKV